MDPNGDGNPGDGIDGWRLDVAAELPMGFWKEFRGWVKDINPDAYLTGEIWWEDYNRMTFRNARPWLDHSFDSVMNYRFGDAVFQFFNQPKPISAAEFGGLLDSIQSDYGYDHCLALLNLYDSHDTARIGSAIVNPQYRQDHGASVQNNREYQIRKPDAEEKRRWKQMVAFQFLALGAPCIYYGDEVGMWGADDPDCRKPMLWSDIKYDPEAAEPSGRPRPTDPVAPDPDLLNFYRQFAKLRRDHLALRRGDFKWVHTDDANRIIAFRRSAIGEEIIAVFNTGDREARLTAKELGLSTFDDWQDAISPAHLDARTLTVPARGCQVLVAK